MEKNNNNKKKLFEILNNEAFTSEFISGIAGDKIQSKEQKKLFEKILRETGNNLYVKLLFFITHKVFNLKEAKQLWDEIIKHKTNLSKQLKRNIEITVATLDYLTNIKNKIDNPKIIGEAFIGKIAEMTSIDPLTKLYNRQHLFVKLDEEIKRYKRYKTTFSILLIDLDDFKQINDTFGHQEGDAALIELSSLLNKSLRYLDICARYGGEEFIIVLPHTGIPLAKKFAERIRIKVKKHFSKRLNLTISIGLSNCPQNAASIKALIKKADDALYVSKKGGKNRFTI